MQAEVSTVMVKVFGSIPYCCHCEEFARSLWACVIPKNCSKLSPSVFEKGVWALDPRSLKPNADPAPQTHLWSLSSEKHLCSDTELYCSAWFSGGAAVFFWTNHYALSGPLGKWRQMGHGMRWQIVHAVEVKRRSLCVPHLWHRPIWWRRRYWGANMFL